MAKKYTKEEKRTFRKKNKALGLITNIITGMFLVSTTYFVLNLLKLSGIETGLRYVVIAGLIIFCLLVIKWNFTLKNQPKKFKFIILILVLIAMGVGEFYASSLISKGIQVVDNMNKDEVKYTSYLIAKKDSNITKKNVKDTKTGIISDTEDLEGYQLAQNIIKDDEIPAGNLVKYDDYITMLNELYSGEIGAAFVQSGYIGKFSSMEKFENIQDDVIVVDKYSKVMKKQVDEVTKSSDKSVTEPFTILLLGVDSADEDINDAIALGDTIMVVTFNPRTLNATLFSIPRDTYVPISCYGNAMSKITHAASGGDSCMISTVENFIDIDIDYYAKVNFRGLMNLVDALGGIDVDVPYSFCETDENRHLANTVYVSKGMQHLDGLQALALSRNRKYYPTCGEEWNEGDRSDFVRGQNQQLVLKAILQKAKKLRTVDDFYAVLDTISRTLDTNLTREQILGFYNVFKKVLLSTDSLTDGNDVISMQRTYLRGGGGIIHDYVAGTGLYEFVPSTEGLNAIKKAMRVNLELEEEEYKTSFSFSIDKPYEPEIIGEDLWGGVTSYPSASTASDEEETTEETSTCNSTENRELGADLKTCVCKWGYTENSSGKCVRDIKSTCKSDEKYDAKNDVCVKKGSTEEEIPEKPIDPIVDPDDPEGGTTTTPDDPEAGGGESGQEGGTDSSSTDTP